MAPLDVTTPLPSGHSLPTPCTASFATASSPRRRLAAPPDVSPRRQRSRRPTPSPLRIEPPQARPPQIEFAAASSRRPASRRAAQRARRPAPSPLRIEPPSSAPAPADRHPHRAPAVRINSGRRPRSPPVRGPDAGARQEAPRWHLPRPEPSTGRRAPRGVGVRPLDDLAATPIPRRCRSR
jgi:hypothetical protein